MSPPIEGRNRGKVLALPSAGTNDSRRIADRENQTEQSAPTELTLQGRRYRLVPVDAVPDDAVQTAPAIVDLLTARELQIIALVAEGRVNKQIADSLRISEFTVATHLRRIFTKLGVDTRAAMVSKCLKALAEHEP